MIEKNRNAAPLMTYREINLWYNGRMSMENTTTQKSIEETSQEAAGNDIETGQAKPSIENTGDKNIENAPIDFIKESHSLDSMLQDATKSLTEKQAAYDNWKKKLDETYASLGGSTPELKYPDQKTIDDQKAEVERLNIKKQELETGEEMEGLLTTLSLLPKSELKIIIETGKNSKGEEVRGKDGKKLKPEAAKSLAQLAFDGAKKITMAILSVVTGIIGGISSGMYESQEVEG